MLWPSKIGGNVFQMRRLYSDCRGRGAGQRISASPCASLSEHAARTKRQECKAREGPVLGHSSELNFASRKSLLPSRLWLKSRQEGWHSPGTAARLEVPPITSWSESIPDGIGSLDSHYMGIKPCRGSVPLRPPAA